MRLLEVVRRELGADDARIELGGRPPSDPHLLWREITLGWRLVAVFAGDPPNRDALQQRLDVLTASFADLGHPDLSERIGGARRAVAQRRLDDELHSLALRVGAVRVLVIDDRSPVVWGTSEERGTQDDIETAIAIAAATEEAERVGFSPEQWVEAEPETLAAEIARRGCERSLQLRLENLVRNLRDASRRRGRLAWGHHLLAMRAVAAVRRAIEAGPGGRAGHLKLVQRNDRFGYFARGFASIYAIILVYEGRFSELHAEAALLQALPLVERLVLALPSTDPPPAGGKLVRLPR